LLRRLRDESLIALTSDQVLIGDLDRLMKDVRGI
jgi:hypothetical protein